MAQSAATLAMVPADADIGVEVDLAKLGIDLDEDGAIAPQESAAAIMAALARMAATPPDAGARLVFRFDRADGYWLQGYANFLMAQADFWLAHDFRQAFDESFHMLFPKAKLPMQDALVPLDDAAAAACSPANGASPISSRSSTWSTGRSSSRSGARRRATNCSR